MRPPLWQQVDPPGSETITFGLEPTPAQSVHRVTLWREGSVSDENVNTKWSRAKSGLTATPRSPRSPLVLTLTRANCRVAPFWNTRTVPPRSAKNSRPSGAKASAVASSAANDAGGAGCAPTSHGLGLMVAAGGGAVDPAAVDTGAVVTAPVVAVVSVSTRLLFPHPPTRTSATASMSRIRMAGQCHAGGFK